MEMVGIVDLTVQHIAEQEEVRLPVEPVQHLMVVQVYLEQEVILIIPMAVVVVVVVILEEVVVTNMAEVEEEAAGHVRGQLQLYTPRVIPQEMAR